MAALHLFLFLLFSSVEKENHNLLFLIRLFDYSTKINKD